MPHMAALGSNGFSVYEDDRFLASFFPTIPPSTVGEEKVLPYKVGVPNDDGFHDITIYMPLYGAYNDIMIKVEEGAEIHDSIVMPGAVIKKGAVVEYAIVGENSIVGENAKIGSSPENMSDLEKWGIAVVGSGLEVGKNAEVKPQTMLSENLKEGECQ